MMQRLLVLLALVGCSQAFFDLWGGPSWDGLAVTWGPNPLSSVYFSQLPRTESDAQSSGWTKVSDCSETGFFRGKQYMKDNDPSAIVLFGKNGYIAGLQTGVPAAKNWPTPSMKFKSNFNYDAANNLMVQTAYFVPPRDICSAGRSSDQYSNEGTGTNLYLQQGPDPVANSVMIPKMEKDIGNTMWTKGNCFVTMGQHYWYDLRDDMPLDEFYPAFLLYNAGELNAFGWAMNVNLDSPRYEHPTPSVFDKFMARVPTVLQTVDQLSTMHIYMDDYPLLNIC
ncbi:uncharacterized protein LOC135489330 [Lineus longissimus]|uniref:uncharacterized protein LOC135489330 n=1 Tax=Lineus longissimus TaxID=88925 RepID=UPI002B4C9F2D